MKKKIAVVFGGFSGEREVSRNSGNVVYQHLQGGSYEPYLVEVSETDWLVHLKDKTVPLDKGSFTAQVEGEKLSFDGVFNAVHGTPGENGVLQGYFDLLAIPYNSGSVLNSSLTFHKKYCNDLLKQYGISSALSVSLRKGETFAYHDILDMLGLPCFVKPNKGGSSLGITKVKNPSELPGAIDQAFEEDDEIVVEQFLEGIEVTCGVINWKGEIRSIGVTEIVTNNEFFDYKAKYLDKTTQEITPARIPETQYGACEDITKKIYRILNCKGMIRADFIIQNGAPFLIEVNTVPGLSEASIVPKMAAYSGISLTDLFENECDQLFK